MGSHSGDPFLALERALLFAFTWTSKRAQNDGPISQNREYRQYRVHHFGHFGGPGSCLGLLYCFYARGAAEMPLAAYSNWGYRCCYCIHFYFCKHFYRYYCRCYHHFYYYCSLWGDHLQILWFFLLLHLASSSLRGLKGTASPPLPPGASNSP